MSTNTVTQEQATADMNAAVKQISDLLKDPNNPNNPGALWVAWHYLQVFSVWGIRIPATEQTLKLALSMDDPGKYAFFPTMLDGNQKVNEACTNFYQNIFPGVIKVGHSLLNTAKDIDPNDGDIFGVLIEMLDNKEFDGCLELIKDLQATAHENVTQAAKVEQDLATFSGQLVSAQGTLDTANKEIQANEETSEAAIKQAQGGDDVLGSLANIQKLIDETKKEYDHDVVVATTTLTYAWVVPVGTIAAAIVAGVFGDKAVKALKRYDELKAQFSAANAKFAIALKSNEIQKLANKSINETIGANNQAIAQTVIVKNAWLGIVNSLNVVSEKVFNMTKITDDQEVLKATALVKAYAKQAGKSWGELVPPLKELTTNPYIVVEQNDKTIAELANSVEKELAVQK